MPHVRRSAPLVRSQITWSWSSRCHVPFDSKLLRVETVSEGIHELENIFGGVNLRFVCGCFELSSSISLLWNLQTLIVQGRHRGITIAPDEIWEMTQLRHLQVLNVFLPDPFPSDIGMVLRNLQTLETVVNLRLSDEVCKRIPNIKELKMVYSRPSGIFKGYCNEVWSYCPHNLGRLQKLESLHCTIRIKGPEWHEFALALTFPSSLKKLSLSWVDLDWEEITMKIGALPLLEVLELIKVKGGAEWNPVDGGFSRLRSLHISSCDDLTNWNVESSHFPVLEHLTLYDVKKMDELPCGIGEIPTLDRAYRFVGLQRVFGHFSIENSGGTGGQWKPNPSTTCRILE